MNTFTQIMAAELLEIFAQADQDDSVRVVVVTGAGPVFCAGADLSYGASSSISPKETAKRFLLMNIGIQEAK